MHTSLAGVRYDDQGLTGLVCVTQDLCILQGVHWQDAAPGGMGAGTLVVVATLQISILYNLIVVPATGSFWVSIAKEREITCTRELHKLNAWELYAFIREYNFCT